MFAFKEKYPNAAFRCPVVFAFKEEEPTAVLAALEVPLLVFPRPILTVFAIISLLNVLAPAKVCAPVVTTPPFVPSAAANIKLLPLTVAPLA